MEIELEDIEYISETTLTIRGTRRRTTVPKYVFDKLNLKSGDKIRWIFFRDGHLAITKVDKRN